MWNSMRAMEMVENRFGKYFEERVRVFGRLDVRNEKKKGYM